MAEDSTFDQDVSEILQKDPIVGGQRFGSANDNSLLSEEQFREAIKKFLDDGSALTETSSSGERAADIPASRKSSGLRGTVP